VRSKCVILISQLWKKNSELEWKFWEKKVGGCLNLANQIYFSQNCEIYIRNYLFILLFHDFHRLLLLNRYFLPPGRLRLLVHMFILNSLKLILSLGSPKFFSFFFFFLHWVTWWSFRTPLGHFMEIFGSLPLLSVAFGLLSWRYSNN